MKTLCVETFVIQQKHKIIWMNCFYCFFLASLWYGPPQLPFSPLSLSLALIYLQHSFHSYSCYKLRFFLCLWILSSFARLVVGEHIWHSSNQPASQPSIRPLVVVDIPSEVFACCRNNCGIFLIKIKDKLLVPPTPKECGLHRW